MEKRLEALIDIAHGYAFDGSDFSTFADPDKPMVLTPGNYTEQSELSFTTRNTKRFNGSLPTAYLFDPGDLTIVMTDLSSKMKILGKPAFVRQSNVLHNQRIGRVRMKSSDVSLGYLYYFLRKNMVSREIKKTATGTMVKHTAPKRILSISMPFPKKLREQEAISTCLSGLAAETQQLEANYWQKLDALTDLEQAILKKAFAGELTAEPERALKEAAE